MRRLDLKEDVATVEELCLRSGPSSSDCKDAQQFGSTSLLETHLIYSQVWCSITAFMALFEPKASLQANAHSSECHEHMIASARYHENALGGSS